MEEHELDEMVAALRLVGTLLTKGKPDELKALLTGEASLGVVHKGWKIMPPGSRLPIPPKVEIPPAPRVRSLILETRGADGRVALLRNLGMNQTQARQLAKALGVTSAGRSTVDQAIDQIVGHFGAAGAGADDEGEY